MVSGQMNEILARVYNFGKCGGSMRKKYFVLFLVLTYLSIVLPCAGANKPKTPPSMCKINYFGLKRIGNRGEQPLVGSLITLEYEIEYRNYRKVKVFMRGHGEQNPTKKTKKSGNVVLKGQIRVKLKKTTTYTITTRAYPTNQKLQPIKNVKSCTIKPRLDPNKLRVAMGQTLKRPDATTAWGGYLPGALHTVVYRVRWDKKGLGWATADGFGFWGSVNNTRQRKMYVSEFWGPRGSGQFRNKAGHDQAFYMGSRPKPKDIKNVFLFCAGQAGLGRPSVTTGQGEAGPFKGRGHQTRVDPIWRKSWAGQLVLNYKRYENYYNPSDSLLAMAMQHQYDIATSDDELRNIANGYMNYLIERTENFRNVHTVWFGGNSRGGALSIRLAKMLKKRIVNGQSHPPARIKIIVTTSDAVAARNDHLEDRGHVMIWNGRSSADKYDFEALFPYQAGKQAGGPWVSNLHIRLCVGASRGVHSMVHKTHREYSDALKGGFFSQVFDDRSHKHMCAQWHLKNGDQVLAYFYSKAFGANDYVAVGN